jgi:hypothetical protein
MESLNLHIQTVESKQFGVFWETMFIIAAGFPENPTNSEKEIYRSFYYLFLRLIPCGKCRAYAIDVLDSQVIINLENPANLFLSLYKWKSIVNDKLGKTNDSFEKVLSKYLKYRIK